MITNERQYRITKRQLLQLKKAIRDFDIVEGAGQSGSGLLAKAEMDALKSEVSILVGQLEEYEALRSGEITQLKASNLEELPKILIRARIAQGLTQRKLGELVGLKEQQIQRYESDEYGAASLRRLQHIAGALNLYITEIAEFGPRSKSSVDTDASNMDWNLFPVREMYRRQWFEGFAGSLTEAVDAADTLVPDFLTRIISKPIAALPKRRVRSGLASDEYALLAWKCRILSLATKSNIECEYSAGSIGTQWVKDLARVSAEPNGPCRAKEQLESIGIAVVVEPHLIGTYLDGAALLHDGKPVIGLTLRYDRLDNFWFVLFHELFHVIKHLHKSKLESIFDDLDSESADELENEADGLAQDALIEQRIWDSALPRYTRSSESVLEMANNLHISPAIVAGRIRREAGNYVILNDLVGQGEVRKQFTEASFGN